MKKTSILLFVLLFANGLFAQTTDSIKTSFDTLSAAYERFFEELNAIQERQTIREICGIPFGTSYEEARQRLYNKYGEPEYYPDRSVISFKNKVSIHTTESASCICNAEFNASIRVLFLSILPFTWIHARKRMTADLFLNCI